MKSKIIALAVLLVLAFFTFQGTAGFVPDKRTVYQQCTEPSYIPHYKLVCVSAPNQGCFSAPCRPEP